MKEEEAAARRSEHNEAMQRTVQGMFGLQRATQSARPAGLQQSLQRCDTSTQASEDMPATVAGESSNVDVSSSRGGGELNAACNEDEGMGLQLQHNYGIEEKDGAQSDEGPVPIEEAVELAPGGREVVSVDRPEIQTFHNVVALCQHA
ncbi:hypothetical protein AB1Y20_004353 [Prymnesium parvum]|uniref:Uncharacterized protein n=1 Tax=Prymnesium parvum TaxID=97485 RepID=A0AB34IYJ8_PRYPA